jgi:hypothetical protein
MKPTWFVIAGVAIVALILAPLASASPSLPVASASPSIATTYEFEDSVAPWTPGDSLQRTRDTLLLADGKGATCTSDQSLHFAQLTARGLNENEVLWLETSVPAEGAVTVSLNWFTRDVSSCGSNCAVVAYAGSTPPMSEDFTSILPIYPSQSWKQYQYKVPLSAHDTVYVAIGIHVTGISGLPGVPQAGIDCVTVQVDNNNLDNP